MKARDGIEAQRGLNDVWPGDEYPDPLNGIRPNGLADGKLVQALHAAISRRSWHDVEVAANAIRDGLMRAAQQEPQ